MLPWAPRAAMASVASLRALLSRETGFAAMQEVLPFRGLWIGPEMAARSPAVLREQGITHILSCNGQPPLIASLPGFRDAFTLRVVDLDDMPGEDIIGHVAACNEFIDAGRAQKSLSGAAGGVLVHCTMGMSRSAAVVIAYVMCAQRCAYDDAFALVRRVRPWVQPNAGFVAQLRVRAPLLLPRGSASTRMRCVV